MCISPSCRGLCRRCERYGNVCWETLEQVPARSPAPAHQALLAPATIQIFLFVKNISMFEESIEGIYIGNVHIQKYILYIPLIFKF